MHILARVLVGLLMSSVAAGSAMTQSNEDEQAPSLLTDPFLQLPTQDSVRVVWFTEFAGKAHTVTVGEQQFAAETIKLSRMAEDDKSWVGSQKADGKIYEGYTPRDIWRHEAVVTGLAAGERVSYTVSSQTAEGKVAKSDDFTLAPLPRQGQDLNILLTSDHQLMPMTAANMQKVEETIGKPDAIFIAGDFVDIPDRASEWFDDNRITEWGGGSFFQNIQGNSLRIMQHNKESGGATTIYKGGELAQHAPIYTVVGNHEVMGRYDTVNRVFDQFYAPQPRAVALARYERMAAIVNPENDPEVREQWLKDNSFNTTSYEELFTLPESDEGGELYYAQQFGDVYLIGLYATRIWRSPSMDKGITGKYREADANLNRPDNWGYGDFIFEDLQKGSKQYDWLIKQLNSDAFKNAKYKVVMMHQGPHGVGKNYNPVFAHPKPIYDYDEAGNLSGIRYDYALEEDVLVRDIEPLLSEAGVHLVHSGHSHLWFRMQNKSGVNFLETSNVGNSYGCYVAQGSKERNNVPNDERFDSNNYAKKGDPHGLAPIMPNIDAFWTDDQGKALPCVDSNEYTTFSILNTGTGKVSSYYFDTRKPDSGVVKFDEFALVSGD